MGVGVARDDIVIIPSFTFIATANAVSHAGAAVWLMDIDPKSWTLNYITTAKKKLRLRKSQQMPLLGNGLLRCGNTFTRTQAIKSQRPKKLSKFNPRLMMSS